MRNSISRDSAKKATGSTLSSHHSGVTSVLIDTEPAVKLASAARAPYQVIRRQQVRPRKSTAHSKIQPSRFGTARRTMSTRMCCPRRSSHGAVSMVTR